MERDEAKRTDIENSIVALVGKLQLHERSNDGVYIDLDRLQEFSDECRTLVEYYQMYTDTTIGIEVVRVYADFARYFRSLISDTNVGTVRFRAQEWLDEIEAWMDDIISEAAKNWTYLNSDE